MNPLISYIQGCSAIRKTLLPRVQPLPRWEILEMWWFLNGVVAISGAADLEDDYGNDDDDDGDMIPSHQEQIFDSLDEWESFGERQSEITESLSPSSSP